MGFLAAMRVPVMRRVGGKEGGVVGVSLVEGVAGGGRRMAG